MLIEIAKGKLAALVLFITLAALVLGVLWSFGRDLQAVIVGIGDGSPAIFVLFFAVGATLFVPVSVLSLTSGVLFGPVFGTIYTLIAATSSATMSFLLVRWLGRDWVTEHLGKRGHRVQEVISDGGWRSVAMLRLVPLMPFAPLNYALGLCDVKPLHYVLATFVFMAPVRFAYAYVGSVGWTSISEGRGLSLGLAATVVACTLVILAPVLLKRYRRREQI